MKPISHDQVYHEITGGASAPRAPLVPINLYHAANHKVRILLHYSLQYLLVITKSDSTLTLPIA